jgi:hypothetical protein
MQEHLCECIGLITLNLNIHNVGLSIQYNEVATVCLNLSQKIDQIATKLYCLKKKNMTLSDGEINNIHNIYSGWPWHNYHDCNTPIWNLKHTVTTIINST